MKQENYTIVWVQQCGIIDRRPKCHIKGISGEKFATTVCSAPTMAYLDGAVTFRLVLADLKLYT